MVATITSYDVNLFNSTYDNIRLIADKIWEYNQSDPYRKLNRSLWIKISKLSRNRNIKRIKFVSHVIPDSRLSRYGNYHYDDERESLYVRDVEGPVAREPFSSGSESREPWLHPTVKEYFTRLKSRPSQSESLINLVQAFSDDNSSDSGSIDEEYKRHSRPPYTINSPAELQLKLRITSDKVLNLWSNNSAEQLVSNDGQAYSCCENNKQQQMHQSCQVKRGGIENQILCNVQTHAIVISRNRYRENDCKCSAKTSVPILSAEVPEFFPKGVRLEAQYESVPHQYFPSVQEKIYNGPALPNVGTVLQNHGIPLLATPIMTPMIRAPQWLPRLAPQLQIQVPVCTLAPQAFTTIQSICPIIHRPIQFNDKIIQQNQVNSSGVPAYQRPLEYIQETRRKNQSVDIKNLILLTKSGMKTRRSQSKQLDTCNLSLEAGKNHYQTDNIQQLGDRRVQLRRPKQFITSTPVTRDFRNFDCQFDADTMSGSNSLDNDNEDELLTEFLGIKR